MLNYLLDWLGLLVRWIHIITGIAWIGASFYFVWLDNHLQPPEDRDAAESGIGGELWAVHGGGFYRAQKFRLAPTVLPATLHWFYWEAYSTWLSGFVLLGLLYFLRADAYLIDPQVAALTAPAAIAIALAFMIGSWLAYDALCRSALGRRPPTVAAILGLLLAAEAWGLCRLFSGRGAFMVFGAAIGTIMVANVLFVIIPGQRELVHAKKQGRDPDPGPGLRGKQRSVHNTYFTMPVLFVMISNHYAMTFGARYNWLVLVAICFAGASIRYWFVARHKAVERAGHTPVLPAVLGLLALVAVIVALSPVHELSAAGRGAGAEPVGAERVEWIVQARCVPCHARKPTQFGFAAPPNGLVLETVDQLVAHLPEVRKQLVAHTMPLGNLTQMSEPDRQSLLSWIDAGAPH